MPAPPADPDRYVLELQGYASPPLSLNHRHHWRVERRHGRALRELAGWLGKAARMGGPHEFVTVTLHWRPPRRGTYDEDNPAPTLKHLADGLTDTGLVVDDTHQHMAKRVHIHDPVKGEPGRLWLTVEIPTVEIPTKETTP